MRTKKDRERESERKRSREREREKEKKGEREREMCRVGKYILKCYNSRDMIIRHLEVHMSKADSSANIVNVMGANIPITIQIY